MSQLASTAGNVAPRTRTGRADGLFIMRWAVVLALVLIVVVPLVALIKVGIDPTALTVFSDPAVLEALTNSVVSATISAMIATTLGVIFAIVLDRLIIPGAQLIRWLLLIPFLIPPFIGAMAWMALLGVNGPVNRILEQMGLEANLSIFGGSGVILLLTIHSYPLAFLVVSTALRRVPGNLEEAARISGASTFKVMTTVTLPLMRPGIVAALILTLVANLSDFGIPALIGLPEGYTTLTTLVYRYLASATISNPLPAASAIGMVLLVVALVTILAQRRMPTASQLSDTAVAQKAHPGRGMQYLLSATLWAWIVLICIVPMVALSVQALLPAPGVPLIWENLTFDNFGSALTSRGAVQGLQNSLMLAGSAAVICGVLGLLVGIVLTRSRSRLNPAIDVLATLPQALPGLVIAVGWLLIAPMLKIFNTPWVILGAYVMAFIALVVQQVRAPLATISSSLEESAQISGATHARAVLDITARMVTPAVITGIIVVFFTAVRELTISILLVAPGSQTLGVTIFNLQQAGNYNAASALAVVVALVGMIGLSFAGWLGSRRAS